MVTQRHLKTRKVMYKTKETKETQRDVKADKENHKGISYNFLWQLITSYEAPSTDVSMSYIRSQGFSLFFLINSHKTLKS